MDRPSVDAKVDSIISLLEIDDFADRQTKGFSQGQRTKVALARALVHDPRTHPRRADQRPRRHGDALARDLILKLRDAGRCVLFSSHVMQEVAALVRRHRASSRPAGWPSGGSSRRAFANAPAATTSKTPSYDAIHMVGAGLSAHDCSRFSARRSSTTCATRRTLVDRRCSWARYSGRSCSPSSSTSPSSARCRKRRQRRSSSPVVGAEGAPNLDSSTCASENIDSWRQARTNRAAAIATPSTDRRRTTSSLVIPAAFAAQQMPRTRSRRAIQLVSDRANRARAPRRAARARRPPRLRPAARRPSASSPAASARARHAAAQRRRGRCVHARAAAPRSCSA